MRRIVTLVAAFLLAASVAAASAPPEGLVKEFTLKNGMRFLVVERPQLPTAACVILYDVGAADEPRGKTGMAHLVEHLMFKGSQEVGTADWAAEKPLFEEANAETLRWIEALDASLKAHPPGVFKGEEKPRETDALKASDSKAKDLLKKEREVMVKNDLSGICTRNGGRQNAFTNTDFTTYFMVFPANKLELWGMLENQRMGHAVFREFYSERDVIMEERRRGEESDPDGRIYETLESAAFTTHPYGHGVIGSWDDLRHLSYEDVESFYKTYYKPNNAVAVVVGGVTADQVKALAAKYFEVIPSGDLPERHWTEEPPLEGRRVCAIRFDAQPQVSWAYRVPGQNHPDFPALQLAADVLGGDENSRLWRQLVLKEKIAVSAGSSCGERRDPYLLHVGVVPFEGKGLDELEKAVYAEIAKLKAEGPSEKELKRVKNQYRAAAVYRLESPLWFAFFLAESKALYGDWRESYRYLDRIDAVTAEDVKRVMAKYAVPDNEIKVTLTRKEAGQ